MSDFHPIVAESFTDAETSALRQTILDWHRLLWRGSQTDKDFLDLWMTGQFDRVEIRCENLINAVP